MSSPLLMKLTPKVSEPPSASWRVRVPPMSRSYLLVLIFLRRSSLTTVSKSMSSIENMPLHSNRNLPRTLESFTLSRRKLMCRSWSLRLWIASGMELSSIPNFPVRSVISFPISTLSPGSVLPSNSRLLASFLHSREHYLSCGKNYLRMPVILPLQRPA